MTRLYIGRGEREKGFRKKALQWQSLQVGILRTYVEILLERILFFDRECALWSFEGFKCTWDERFGQP